MRAGREGPPGTRSSAGRVSSGRTPAVSAATVSVVPAQAFREGQGSDFTRLPPLFSVSSDPAAFWTKSRRPVRALGRVDAPIPLLPSPAFPVLGPEHEAWSPLDGQFQSPVVRSAVATSGSTITAVSQPLSICFFTYVSGNKKSDQYKLLWSDSL